MKKFLSGLLVLAMMLSLSAPAFAASPNEVYDELEGVADSKVTFQVVNTCSHDGSHWKDNGDGTHSEVCDGCGEVLTDREPHVDDDDDGVCDKCDADLTGSGPECNHPGSHWVDNGDGTHDEVCDGCGEVVTDDEPHVDVDGDYVCDKCEAELERPGCGHDEGSHWVDNRDGTHDEVCDGCGDVLTNDEAHVDADGDKVCDKCGALIPNQGPVLIATVPLKLPIIMDLNGNITVSSNAVVQNHVQDKAIAVTDITLRPGADWAIGDMGDDFGAMALDSKVLAISFRHDTHDDTGVFDLTSGNWNVGAADALKLNMAAKVPVQTRACSESEIADVEFVLNWASDADAVSSDASTGAGDQDDINAGIAVGPVGPGTPNTGDFSVEYDAGLLLAGGSKTATLSWSGYDEPVEFESVVVSDPSVAEVVIDDAESSEDMATLSVNGLKLGATEVTAVLSNGDEATFDVEVCEIDKAGIQVSMPEGLAAGDKIATGDVVVRLPVKHPDGTTSEIVVRPEIDAMIGEGKNEFAFDVSAGGKVTQVSEAVFTTASFVVTGANRAMVGYTGAANEELVIPSEFDGEDGVHYVVTGIGNSAFKDCAGLSSVVIPDSVTFIGYGAFLGCSFSSVVIPAGVTAIYPQTFQGCSNLSSVVIPDGVTSIGGYAFYDCTGLTSVTIPDSVTSIDYAAFLGCANLSSLKVPSSVISIGQGAFALVPKVIYNGTATGSPWGAKSVVKS